MALWDKFKLLMSKRKGTGLEVGRWQMAPPRKGTPELLRAYKEMPWLQAVVRKVATGTAAVRWRVYSHRDEAEGEKAVSARSIRNVSARNRREEIKAMRRSRRAVEVANHALVALLANPNEHMSGNTFIRICQTHLDLVGESFVAVERLGTGGPPVSFWPVPPSSVISLPRSNTPGEPREYKINFGGKVYSFPAENMVHLRDPDPDDPLGRGIGPGFSLGDELDTLEYASLFAKNFLFNNGVPAAIASIEGAGESTGPSIMAFKESLARTHEGPQNAGKILFTNGKVSVSRLDTNFKDAEMVDHRQYLQDFVRQCYGVPSTILGAAAATYAEARTAGLIMAEQVVDPRMEFLCGEFGRAFSILLGPDEFLDYDSPIPADREHELKVAAVAPWSRSVNEWRALQGLEPLAQFVGVFPPLALPGQTVGDADGEKKPEKKPDPKKDIPGDPPWVKEPIG